MSTPWIAIYHRCYLAKNVLNGKVLILVSAKYVKLLKRDFLAVDEKIPSTSNGLGPGPEKFFPLTSFLLYL